MSLNALKCTYGVVDSVWNQFTFISVSIFIMGIILRIDWYKAMYSTSVMDSAIYIYVLIHQMVGQPAYMMA